MYTTTYKLTGNTYPNRTAIKAAGFRWDAGAKAWIGKVGGNGMEQALWKLRRSGVKVEKIA